MCACALECWFVLVHVRNCVCAGIALRVAKVHIDKAGKPLARHEERKEPLKHSENEVSAVTKRTALLWQNRYQRSCTR